MPGDLEANAMQTVQTPVTGAEDRGDHSQPLQALAQFYRALNARDIDMMAQNWEPSADAAMDNPLGGIKRGWTEIRSVYEKLFATESTYRFEFYDYTLHQSADVFYVVGRERGTLESRGGSLELAIRTTRIFRRGGGGAWHQVHHHGSIEDPRMLAAYQEAVLGKQNR
jgi:ketosteroid isomerase-like protein